MKNSKINVWHGALSLMVVLAFAFTSCTKNPLLPSRQQDKESMDLLLELTPPGAFTSASTRAMTDAEQNAIDSAQVLVFDAKDGKLLYHKSATGTNVSGVIKGLKVTLRISQTESELFDIMVIGNPPKDYPFSNYIGQTKSKLIEDFNGSATNKWSGRKFIMYGEVLQTLIKPAINTFKIQMLRSLARVDIGVGGYDETTGKWAGLAGVFSLTEVRVVNSRNKFAAIPYTTTFNESGNLKVSEPSIPAGTVVQGTDAATAIKYSDPTEIIDGNYTQSTIFLAEAPNEEDRVTLLIGGSYMSGPTTYYRVDMCSPNADLTDYEYFNILRNHLYRINIVSISGAGFSDPQVALTSPPVNITATLTPIEEGGSGHIIFDGNNYLQTDVSRVEIYGKPDGKRAYTIASVTATFTEGASATISGGGITPITLNLTSGVATPVSIVLPVGATSENITIAVGKLIKVIPLRVQASIDSHFDFLPFANVASITVENPQPWLTLSQRMVYRKSEQQSLRIIGNSEGKAYIHFDENVATNGEEPRVAQALLQRNNSNETIRIHLEQVNLSGMVLGLFGGDKDQYGYTKQLALESIEEYRYRQYDDLSIGYPTEHGLRSGGIFGASDIESGRAETIIEGSLATPIASIVQPPYTIYDNFATRYCYDKNRDTNENDKLDDDEVLWYQPAYNQMIAAAMLNDATTNYFEYEDESSYWTSSALAKESKLYNVRLVDFNNYDGYGEESRSYYMGYIRRVRCVRDL